MALEQIYAFLESLVLGIALGSCFDLYRALRLQGKGRVITAASVIADCLFWVGAAVVCIVVIINRRWGEMYLYNYLALAGGFTGYVYCFSRFLLPIWIRLFRFVIKVVNIFITPFRSFARRAERAAGTSRKLFSELFSRIHSCFRRRTS